MKVSQKFNQQLLQKTLRFKAHKSDDGNFQNHNRWNYKPVHEQGKKKA